MRNVNEFCKCSCSISLKTEISHIKMTYIDIKSVEITSIDKGRHKWCGFEVP